MGAILLLLMTNAVLRRVVPFGTERDSYVLRLVALYANWPRGGTWASSDADTESHVTDFAGLIRSDRLAVELTLVKTP